MKNLIVIMFSLVFVSCMNTVHNNSSDIDTTIYNQVDTSLLKPRFIDILRSFINTHNSNYYLMCPTMHYIDDNSKSDITNDIFYICQAKSYYIGKGEFAISSTYPRSYIKLNGKYILCLSPYDVLGNSSIYEKEYMKISKNNTSVF